MSQNLEGQKLPDRIILPYADYKNSMRKWPSLKAGLPN
jgi:hypothetical protein